MSEHIVSVAAVGNGQPDFAYRATCTCRWRGIKTTNRQVAEAQAEEHLRYRASVVELTR